MLKCFATTNLLWTYSDIKAGGQTLKHGYNFKNQDILADSVQKIHLMFFTYTKKTTNNNP